MIEFLSLAFASADGGGRYGRDQGDRSEGGGFRGRGRGGYDSGGYDRGRRGPPGMG